MDRSGKPAVVIYRAVAEYLKVLGLVSVGALALSKLKSMLTPRWDRARFVYVVAAQLGSEPVGPTS